MQLPFTAEQVFDAFSRYNLAIWPAQWILTVLALTAVGLTRQPAHLARRPSSRPPYGCGWPRGRDL